MSLDVHARQPDVEETVLGSEPSDGPESAEPVTSLTEGGVGVKNRAEPVTAADHVDPDGLLEPVRDGEPHPSERQISTRVRQ